jgi:hypothetical protein
MTQFMYIEGRDFPALQLAIHDEVIDVASALGDRQLLAITVAGREITKRWHRDWPSVLRAIADASVHFKGGSYAALAVGSLRDAAIAFIALEHFEPGAVLLGFADAQDAYSRKMFNDDYNELLTGADNAILDALGEANLSDLKARGGALDLPNAVVYLRTEADRALAGNRR